MLPVAFKPAASASCPVLHGSGGQGQFHNDSLASTVWQPSMLFVKRGARPIPRGYTFLTCGAPARTGIRWCPRGSLRNVLLALSHHQPQAEHNKRRLSFCVPTKASAASSTATASAPTAPKNREPPPIRTVAYTYTTNATNSLSTHMARVGLASSSSSTPAILEFPGANASIKSCY